MSDNTPEISPSRQPAEEPSGAAGNPAGPPSDAGANQTGASFSAAENQTRAGSGTATDPSGGSTSSGPKNPTSGLTTLQQAFAVLGLALTTAANIKLFFEQQWAFAVAMLILCAIGASLWILVSIKKLGKDSHNLRRTAYSILAIVPAITLAIFIYDAFWPRITEDGPIVAVVQFRGPKLPPPYEDCRPSDMLTDALADIHHRYAHLTAFELPYIIEPDDRWARLWAVVHGFLAGADTVVYGEYSFVDHELSANKPDRLLISPQTDQVPTLPLGPRVAPLTKWEFPDRLVRIDELCTGHSQRFLRDGKRLFLAIVGLQAFAAHEYVGAERALSDAERSQDDDDAFLTEQPKNNTSKTQSANGDDSQCDRVPASASQCSGVLAFYLAVLEQRMGHYKIAEREFAFAAAKLNRPAPYVDLAELYAVQNEGSLAIQALKSAESVDPDSLLVAATRARYEYEFGDTEVGALELDRALDLKKSQQPSDYESVALCRALYLRDSNAGLDCLMNVPRGGYGNSADAEVERGRWLIATHRLDLLEAGLNELRRAAVGHPLNIKANYTLARALTNARSSQDPEARQCYLRAVNARAFTDDDFTDQGNAEVELGNYDRARSLYQLALDINPRFAYAYENLGRMYERLHKSGLARADFLLAAKLHPRDINIRVPSPPPLRSASVTDRKPSTAL